jgi:glycerol-3-phosphate dehydrogenase (NAD(P)+)
MFSPLAAGIADGLGFWRQHQGSINYTRGLNEIIRLGVKLGGKQETFMGLAGLGDLILTCTDNQSRNRRFGLALGLGKGQNRRPYRKLVNKLKGYFAAKGNFFIG